VGGRVCRWFVGAVTAGETASIALFVDIARFRPDDPDTLVHASLACPVCLRSDDVEWEGSLRGYDPSVQCWCPSCSQRWRVYLAPEQALRLGLMPAHAA
jgi:hypothetical protein